MSSAVQRPDLESLPYGSPEFIAPMILPRLSREVDGGTIYYADINSDMTAVSARTIGDAPVGELVGKASTTWALVTKDKMVDIDDREIAMMGGLDKAQQIGARLGKRAVASLIEIAAIAATFGNVGIAKYNILSSLLGAVDDAVSLIADKADGKIVLFGAKSMIQRVKRLTEVKARMIHTGVPIGSERDVRSISDNILAGVLGVDAIFAGRSSWLGAQSAYNGYLGLMVLPDAAFEPIETIQFGRTLVRNVAGGSDIFEISTHKSDDAKCEKVYTAAQVDVKIFNPETCVILTGLDEGNAVTTTV